MVKVNTWKWTATRETRLGEDSGVGNGGGRWGGLVLRSIGYDELVVIKGLFYAVGFDGVFELGIRHGLGKGGGSSLGVFT